MRKTFLAVSLTVLSFFARQAHAGMINLDAELLREADGSPMRLTGLVILTAATQGIFTGPTDLLFAGGSEVVLSKWDLASWGTPGVFSGSTGNLSYESLSPNLNAGDPVKLYWFPTLTLSSAVPGASTSYGAYRDSATTESALKDGGTDLWVVPPESGSYSLRLATSDATFLFTGTSSPASATATLTTVPEPSVWWGYAFVILFTGCEIVRRRSLSARRLLES